MKTTALCLGLLLLSISFMSCEKEDLRIVPSNQITTRNHAITDFSELNISDPFEVYIQFSDTERELHIESNDNLHTLIEVKQVNGELSIQLDDRIRQMQGTPVLKVFLTTGNIRKIEAQGAAQIHLQNHWYEDEAEVELTGSSSLEGSLTNEQLTANLTGASTLVIQGSTRFFDLEATGASGMRGFDFAADKLRVDLTGGCQVALSVHEELNVTASGGSKVYYRGEGVVQFQNLSGGSAIIKE